MPTPDTRCNHLDICVYYWARISIELSNKVPKSSQYNSRAAKKQFSSLYNSKGIIYDCRASIRMTISN